MLLLAWSAVATPVIAASNGRHPPVSCGWLLLAGAAWRFVGVAMALPRGSAQPRESLTQDSRSAVKARSFDPSVDHSAKGVAPLAKLAWRPRERPSRGFERFVTRRNALEGRADRGMRAYVTGGAHRQWTTRAGSAVHMRYDITPRRMASSWLATQAERGSCAACTAYSRHLRGGARMKAGDALRCSAGSGRLGAALDRDWERGDHRHEQNDDAP